MTKVSEIYPRLWLRVSDLVPGKVYRAQVVGVGVRDVRGRTRIVITVRGVGGERWIFLNRSSAWALAGELGDDCEGWVGQEVVFRRGRAAGGREAILVEARTAANHERGG